MRCRTGSGRTAALFLLLPCLVLLLAYTTRNGASTARSPDGPALADLQRSFQSPPDDARIMMRWWWFGPSVTRQEIEREMRLLKQGGIGGFEVQPVYPLALDEASSGIKNLPFLSDEFIQALRFASEKARELGLRMDLTLGSGWPYGGPQVPINQAAGMLRVDHVKVDQGSQRVPLPVISSGEKLLASFLANVQGRTINAYVSIPATEIDDGALRLPADLQGFNQVLFFISSRTGMQVKRPAVGAEGFVLDHYDRGAVQHYLGAVGDTLFRAFDSNPPYAVFCDSLEVYNSDWTGDFLEEFKTRRGYDLSPYLPALIGDAGPNAMAVRHDWGQTLTELFNERFLATMREWALRNRTRFRIQCYGIPPAVLSSNAHADLPEGEGSQWRILRASRWASSASHLYGRPVTSSETWTWLHSPVFRASPLDMKAEADQHFLQGINQLIGHGWPYTAEGVEYPGWRFYASGVFDDRNPWWIVMPDIALYLQRISFLLRQGQPVNDVALYLPNSDAWAHFSSGHVNMIETLRDLIGPDIVARLLDSGYNLDFFDDDSLTQVGRIEKGALVLGPARYRVVVLPGVESIPLNTLKKLEEFVQNGGVLIATRRIPDVAPGLRSTPDEQKQLQKISQRLFQGPSAPAHFAQDENSALSDALARLIAPDVRLSPNAHEVGFVHRRTGDADVYFLANTTGVRQQLTATFRLHGMQAEWWDPFSGRVSPAEVQDNGPSGLSVDLDLEGYGSRVLVFSTSAARAHSSEIQKPVAPPIDLSTGWQVQFGQNAPVSMDHLRSWTEDPGTRFFSGQATYEKRITVPEVLLRQGVSLQMDFGEARPIPPQPLKNGMQAWLEAPVREAVVVYINDRRAGSVWCPPYSLDVTGLFRPGQNDVRLVVANLAINYMAGRRLPDYRLLNLRYGERFQPQDMDKVQPVTSGLLGPIRLIATSSGP
ncbi:MAG TPA: glycosyl hydrolase [Blastocatellia bacterium]|nr:glycosyl hydrolase [Blastocatellia bacterium]